MFSLFKDFYKNKKVFLTGHTGFKGSWLSVWLSEMGADVCGYSLSSNTSPSMFNELYISQKIYKSVIGNILDKEKLEYEINDFSPDIVFHLAAQPIVRLSYFEPLLTYETNVVGSLNVLEAARKCPSVKAFVNVTTDKCYENNELKKAYEENDPLGGYDMYSSSKACVEIMSSSFRRSFLNKPDSMALATARAGNVIGGGDWAQDRLIPDCIRAINSNHPIEIRNPHSIRPWQHVLEPLSGYLLLALLLYKNGAEYAQAFNFGPNQESILNVSDIVKKIVELYGRGEIVQNKKDNLHEANFLTLNIKKAENILGWIPSYDVQTALIETIDWYRNFYSKNCNMYDFTVCQIKNYQECIKWNKSFAIK